MKTKNKKAFTFIEVLIAVVVAAMLMTAIAVAFDASSKNYQTNENLFNATNLARQALLRITSQLRSADFVTLPSDEAAYRCSLITADGDDITYEYRDGDDALYLIDNTDSKEYLLCSNVSAMTFTKTVSTVVKNVKIKITVDINGDSKTMAAAAIVRRNM